MLRVSYLPRYSTDEPLRVRSPLWPMPTKHRHVEEVERPVRQVFREVIHGRAPWPLFLYGEAGAGKTCAGMCLVDAVGAGIYATLPDLCRAFADAQFDRIAFMEYGAERVRSEGELWRDWSRANVCVLDEIGSRQAVRDHEYAVLRKALDLRIDAEKPLVAISNLDPAALAKTYDDRIASRLASGTVAELQGDRRVERGLRVVGTGA